MGAFGVEGVGNPELVGSEGDGSAWRFRLNSGGGRVSVELGSGGALGGAEARLVEAACSDLAPGEAGLLEGEGRAGREMGQGGGGERRAMGAGFIGERD
ncbi:uncharacterized protein A4U43_C10F4780 [Asparagus officinalis]|uniref:Uncharacterized protein n=1 Tax=Asparagus officinalis TaxID=4686 RepID=A0A5P1E0Q6_ASPOF|nr:uncharacterized protein A4U43_C10F4780 [Asparagus officinalis]